MVDTVRIDLVTDPLTVTPQSRNVQTGTGLTGGGDLSADRTLALTPAAIASLALADTSLQPSDETALLADATFTGPVKFPDGTAALPSITNTGDVNNGIYFPAADVLGFTTAGTFAAMFDATQRFVLGHTTAIAIGATTPRGQQHGTDAATTQNAGFRWSADALGSVLALAKSRNATPGSHTVVQSADVLGSLVGYGSDGTAFINAGGVQVLVDGTPGTNDMPGRVALLTTADGSSTLTEAMRVDNAQRVVIGGNAATAIGANTPRGQLHGASDSTANSAVARWSADASGPILALAKSRNATVGSHTVVQSGDVLGSLIGYGSDGTGMIPAASIDLLSGGTPGTNDMPGEISLKTTADGASTLTERVTVDAAGMLTVSYGITTAAGTTTIPPWKMTSGTNMTSVTAGAWEYDGKALYFAHAASARGVVAVKQIVTVQGSAVSLANNTAAFQTVFAAANDTFTLEASTTYRFRGHYKVNTGSTSHLTAIAFDSGSATFTNFSYKVVSTSSAANTLATPQMRRVDTDAAATITAASTAVTTDIWFEGIMRVNGGGTMTPQIGFSAGPTGTCEIAVNSFMELEPIGSNTVAAVGNWA